MFESWCPEANTVDTVTTWPTCKTLPSLGQQCSSTMLNKLPVEEGEVGCGGGDSVSVIHDSSLSTTQSSAIVCFRFCVKSLY